MAWIEDQTWTVEQGVDALFEVHLYEDEAKTTPWDITDWDVYGVIQNESNRKIADLTVETVPEDGIVKFFLLEATANSLKPGAEYYFDGLLVSPEPELADDYHLAFVPVDVQPRAARRAA